MAREPGWLSGRSVTPAEGVAVEEPPTHSPGHACALRPCPRSHQRHAVLRSEAAPSWCTEEWTARSRRLWAAENWCLYHPGAPWGPRPAPLLCCSHARHRVASPTGVRAHSPCWLVPIFTMLDVDTEMPSVAWTRTPRSETQKGGPGFPTTLLGAPFTPTSCHSVIPQMIAKGPLPARGSTRDKGHTSEQSRPSPPSWGLQWSRETAMQGRQELRGVTVAGERARERRADQKMCNGQ